MEVVSFDYKLWTNNGSTDDSWTKSQKFINRVLLLSDLVNIDRFSITWVDPRDLSHLKIWDSVAIRRNVSGLELNIRNFYPDDLPDSIYTSRVLEVVKLNLDYFIETPLPTEICFPNVKILHITVHSQDNNLTERLFSNYPVIEDLSIRAFLLDSEVVTSINISSPTLRRLNLIIERDEISYNEHHVVVRAPNLEFLYISDFTFVSFEHLFLTFSNLNFLELVVRESGWRFLPIILSSMPKLKAFVLEKVRMR